MELDGPHSHVQLRSNNWAQGGCDDVEQMLALVVLEGDGGGNVDRHDQNMLYKCIHKNLWINCYK